MEEKKEILLRQYLDGELSGSQESEVLHMIADDSEMRSMLRFEQQLRTSATGLAKEPESYVVPDGFSQSVMNAIDMQAEEKEEEASEAYDWDALLEGLKQLWAPRRFQLRPVYAMAAVLLIAAIAVFPYLQGGDALDSANNQMVTTNINNMNTGAAGQQQATYQQASAQSDEVWTRFIYIDKDAESVAVAGDFSNWEPVELTRKTLNGEQVWTGLVPMQKGEHRYMFVKNGDNWVTDPLATNYQNDGFGNKNAVLYL